MIDGYIQQKGGKNREEGERNRKWKEAKSKKRKFKYILCRGRVLESRTKKEADGFY